MPTPVICVDRRLPGSGPFRDTKKNVMEPLTRATFVGKTFSVNAGYMFTKSRAQEHTNLRTKVLNAADAVKSFPIEVLFTTTKLLNTEGEIGHKTST